MNELLIIAQLLNTKICHDIAGLIGAINNSLDYTNSSDESIRDQAKSLLQNSSKEAAKRLSFYREAYGAVRDESVKIFLIKNLLEAFLNPDKFSVIIENSSKIEDISQLTLKFCLSMANISYLTLARGGSISFQFSPINNKEIILEKMTLSGKMIIKKEETFSILKGNKVEINSSNINIYYSYLLLKELKKEIIVSEEHEKLIYKFV